MTRGAAGTMGQFEKNLELLILFRLVSSAKPPSRSDVAKALQPFARGRIPDAEWRDAFDRTLEALTAAGDVTGKPLGIADSGRQRVQTALGLSARPKSKNWPDFKRRYLCGFVLGKPSAEGRAADPLNEILARALDVELPPNATLTRLLDAWLAKKLGLGTRPVTMNSLRAELLARELGIPYRVKSPLASTVKLAAARAANSGKADSQSLVDALTAEWLRGRAEAQRSQTTLGLDAVVNKVRAALDGAGLRRFGPNKVFIASIWDALKEDPELCSLGEQGFKRMLGEAHQKGAIALARADLVSAMDPSDVAASELSHQDATYHFIFVTDERP